MTLNFWKYVVTCCHGSAVHFVAEEHRECAEKEMEWARAFSAIKHNHNLNARCSAILPRKFLSSFGEYLPRYSMCRSCKEALPP